MKLFELVDIPARTVEFYFSYGGKRRNHIGVEVFLDGDFRYVDPRIQPIGFLETRRVGICYNI